MAKKRALVTKKDYRKREELVRKEFLVGLILVLLLAFYFLLAKDNLVLRNNAPRVPIPTPIAVKFTCSDEKFINAVFGKESVTLKLSDSRIVELPQTISADGTRYANKDGSFVFWNKGKGAFIQEDNQTTYSNCTTQSN